MNPYDFVPLDITHPPERRRPVWHNALASKTSQLYSGYLYLYIKAETPLFIHDPASSMQDPNYPGQSLRNAWNEYSIPGTSIKGMLRSVVETLCHGCMVVFRTPNEYTHNPIPQGFAACQNNTLLCIACRLFGMMQSERRRPGQRDIDTFLGKVNIGDARAYEDNPALYGPIYTVALDGPKPRHRAFYLDEQGRYVAGRKFYFHHAGEPTTERRLLPIRDTGKYRNQHIEPLARGTDFDVRLDFTNLEADELAALLMAITLQPTMRHKIGYGKPMGLGSVSLEITKLQLVDYATRYTTARANRGITPYEDNALADLLAGQFATRDEAVRKEWQRFSAQPALQHLARIWQWPADKTVEYAYPSQQWFKSHAQARIQDTRNLYPGD